MSESKRTDIDILCDVREELPCNTRVDSSQVTVSVFKGTVTLAGVIDSWSAGISVQEAVRRVRGVLDVVNELAVVPGPGDVRRDTELAQAVRHALEWDVHVPHDRIRTLISDGVVTLEGEVDYLSECEDASRCVRNLIGVREVKNLMTVRLHGGPPPPSHLRAAIEQALARHGAHAASHVDLKIDGGKVTLNGDVPSWVERQVIEGAVRGTRGVAEVETHLRVR